MLFPAINYEIQLTGPSASIAVEAAERRKEVSGRGVRYRAVGLRYQSTAKSYVFLSASVYRRQHSVYSP